jgi:alkanesulfonate monooxygenase SsuD/methylene tetrahydromethanopterin reductase-like flavin-dependent oxidoreductase (luciferase family)
LQDPLPVWIALGGTPQSAARAGMLGLPLAVAIIGGMPERFVPLVDLYRDAAERVGREPQSVAINSHTYVADTTAQAKREYFGSYKAMMDKIGRERGWGPMTREQFEALTDLRGALVVGEPEAVAEKLLFQHGLFGHDRFMAHISVGTLPHAQVLRAIELLGTEVAPVVRAEVARRTAPAPA